VDEKDKYKVSTIVPDVSSICNLQSLPAGPGPGQGGAGRYNLKLRRGGRIKFLEKNCGGGKGKCMNARPGPIFLCGASMEKVRDIQKLNGRRHPGRKQMVFLAGVSCGLWRARQKN
jgi:hypothetical protein